jgi:hypothetical protein
MRGFCLLYAFMCFLVLCAFLCLPVPFCACVLCGSVPVFWVCFRVCCACAVFGVSGLSGLFCVGLLCLFCACSVPVFCACVLCLCSVPVSARAYLSVACAVSGRLGLCLCLCPILFHFFSKDFRSKNREINSILG